MSFGSRRKSGSHQPSLVRADMPTSRDVGTNDLTFQSLLTELVDVKTVIYVPPIDSHLRGACGHLTRPMSFATPLRGLLSPMNLSGANALEISSGGRTNADQFYDIAQHHAAYACFPFTSCRIDTRCWRHKEICDMVMTVMDG